MKQSELEELSFKFAYPEEYAEIKNRVETLRKEQEDVVLEVNDGYSLFLKLCVEAVRSLNLTSEHGYVGEQAKKVLHETISRDQFLGYMTSEINVATLSKELYRYSLFLIKTLSLTQRILPSPCFQHASRLGTSC